MFDWIGPTDLSFHATFVHPTRYGEISIAWHMALRNAKSANKLNPLCNLKNAGERYMDYRDTALLTNTYYNLAPTLEHGLQSALKQGEAIVSINDLLSTQEVADELHVEASRIRQLCRAGQVPGAQKKGRDWWIPREALKELRKRQGPGRPSKPTKRPLA
jgi:excisionase family DNA binding protein